jgi:hypothetical protein
MSRPKKETAQPEQLLNETQTLLAPGADTLSPTEALTAAINSCGNVATSRYNSHFKSKYYALADLLSAVKPILHSYGLCLIQTPTSGADRIVIKTEILHGRTGHLFSFGELGFNSANLNLQQIGSGITYTKRFAISTILGVAGEDEDTDGNSALPSPVASQQKPQPKPAAQPAAPEQQGWWEVMGITATHSIAAARLILKRKGWLTEGQGLADLPADKVQQLSARATAQAFTEAVKQMVANSTVDNG